MSKVACQTPSEIRETAGTLVPAVLIALVALILEAAVFYAPPEQGQLAVFFPPSTTESAAISAIASAGGSFVSSSRFANIVIAYAPDAGFRERIAKQGGWFTLAAEGLCSPSNSQTNI